MIDVVIPDDNEEEFIEIAEKLGYKGIYFLYNLNDYLNQNKKIKKDKIKIYTGVLADDRNISKIKNKLKDSKTFVAVKSSSNDRDVIEKSKVDVVFSFEGSTRKDFIHQRAAGLNHILCKLANENNVIIGFSLSSILNAENKDVILGRVKQNIKICRKFKVKTLVASFATKPFEMRSAHDIKSLFESLGLKNPGFLKV